MRADLCRSSYISTSPRRPSTIQCLLFFTNPVAFQDFTSRCHKTLSVGIAESWGPWPARFSADGVSSFRRTHVSPITQRTCYHQATRRGSVKPAEHTPSSLPIRMMAFLDMLTLPSSILCHLAGSPRSAGVQLPRQRHLQQVARCWFCHLCPGRQCPVGASLLSRICCSSDSFPGLFLLRGGPSEPFLPQSNLHLPPL